MSSEKKVKLYLPPTEENPDGKVVVSSQLN